MSREVMNCHIISRWVLPAPALSGPSNNQALYFSIASVRCVYSLSAEGCPLTNLS